MKSPFSYGFPMIFPSYGGTTNRSAGPRLDAASVAGQKVERSPTGIQGFNGKFNGKEEGV